MTLITRMVVLAIRNRHTLQMPTETWIARPLFEVVGIYIWSIHC